MFKTRQLLALGSLLLGLLCLPSLCRSADPKKPDAKPDAKKVEAKADAKKADAKKVEAKKNDAKKPEVKKADPKKTDAKTDSKAAAKSAADVIGVIGEVKELAGGPSGLMVQHGSRGRNGRQPAKYEEFKIEAETKIEFTGFPKDSMPTLAVDQQVAITLKKGTQYEIAKVVVHPKTAKLVEPDPAPAKKPVKKDDAKAKAK